MSRDILAEIAAYKREDVAARKAREDQTAIEARASAASPPRGFRSSLERAFRPGCPALIAEIKKASPSKGLIRGDFDPPTLAAAYARGGAACLSVLTDGPGFQGADSHLIAARAACALPVIRKDFLIDPWQVAESRALGADAILVILAMVDDVLAADLMAEARRFGLDTLVETHDETEVERAVRLGADLIGINNRDLRTFHTNIETTGRLCEKIPATALPITESGVFTPDDVARVAAHGARAMLVGESLMRQENVQRATEALLSRA